MFFIGDSGSLNSGGWLSSLLGSAQSAAGKVVTPKTALSIPVLQNCVSILAESVAQLPVELYRRTKDGGREVANYHPVYQLLKTAPNAWQTTFEYRELQQLSLGLRGNCYSYIDRDERGRITAIYPLDTEKVQVFRGSDLLPYYNIEGNSDRIPKRFIHHVRWLSHNGYTGLSPVMLHADQIGYSMAMTEYAGKSFSNGTALSGVLERPKEARGYLDKKTCDQITDMWSQKYAGSNNTGKVALLQEGMSFKPLSMTNVDAELINSLKLSGADIAKIYKMPLSMVGEVDQVKYDNVENLQIQFVIYTLMPWLKRHEQAMQRDFLNADEQGEYYIEFNVAGLLRGNITARYQAYAVARQWGWLSVNDIRKLENLPPVDGGDVYLQPLNMVDATKPLEFGKKPDVSAVSEIEKVLQ